MVQRFLFIASTCLLTAVQSYPAYVHYIPNGEYRFYDQAIGHSYGAPDLDDFSIDYQNVNLNWPAVCVLDSDGDGRTNGEELGDPNCTWTRGAKPPLPISSNPGVADKAGDLGTDEGRSGDVVEGETSDLLSEPIVIIGGIALVLVVSIGMYVKMKRECSHNLDSSEDAEGDSSVPDDSSAAPENVVVV